MGLERLVSETMALSDYCSYCSPRHVIFSTDEPFLQFRRNVFYPKSKEQQVLVAHMLCSSLYVILDK